MAMRNGVAAAGGMGRVVALAVVDRHQLRLRAWARAILLRVSVEKSRQYRRAMTTRRIPVRGVARSIRVNQIRVAVVHISDSGGGGGYYFCSFRSTNVVKIYLFCSELELNK
ncbi:unnamed protein product [Ceratitis capitata]|uniref:(Mediterranean fruit fly) hypothetical protein n=1 Tax=Ceratitis capitata TaxID=7213 RepID=A0A811UV32_CERCA|nr:unnamed protein product [Ceratitis capitata]